MTKLRLTPLVVLGLLALLAGCASRPINPPIAQIEPGKGYRYEVHQANRKDTSKEALVILAFSGGGTRAAAFSYGVLEFLGTAAELDFQRFEIVDVLEGPNKVVTEMEVVYVGPNGVRVQDQELHYWVFDDAGKVVGFRHYLDTAKHAAALEGATV